MPGKVVCEKDGRYCFIEAYSNTPMKIRGDKLIDRVGQSDSPHRYEVQHNGESIAEIESYSWRFKELPPGPMAIQ